MPKIVTFGGGTGAPVIIQALLLAGYSNLSCICASMDSGGKTGIIRSDERDQVIAISDLLRNLLALISTKNNHAENIQAFTDLMSYTDGRNRNLGYHIYYGLLEKYQNNFLAVQNHLERMLGVCFEGTAIPVAIQPTNLCFQTNTGSIFKGEHELDKQSLSKNTIKKVWLEPQVAATPEAIEAIEQATHLIYCPGSLYGSVIANLLPIGIKEALKSSKAKKILVTNLVSNRNQTHQFTPEKYERVFRKYSKLDRPFDYLVCPDISQAEFESQYPQIKKLYANEHSHFLGWPKELHQTTNFYIEQADILAITPHLNRLRHDPEKLSRVLNRIID